MPDIFVECLAHLYFTLCISCVHQKRVHLLGIFDICLYKFDKQKAPSKDRALYQRIVVLSRVRLEGLEPSTNGLRGLWYICVCSIIVKHNCFYQNGIPPVTRLCSENVVIEDLF